MSQNQMILKALRKWITPIEALDQVGTMKLATRVGELRRAGHDIADRWIEANGKRFKAYRLITKAKDPARCSV